jgi:hypothetical protein
MRQRLSVIDDKGDDLSKDFSKVIGQIHDNTNDELEVVRTFGQTQGDSK